MESLTPTAGAYVVLLLLLGVYGLHRISLLLRFRWERPSPKPAQAVAQSPQRTPKVTVQLPLYNERTVVARLIAAVGAMDYPRDCFEVQVLDDSTDDTSEIVDREVAALVAKGVSATVVRRADRTGYKAGALNHGMKLTDSDFLCVFDADFIPGPDFLSRLMPHFGESLELDPGTSSGRPGLSADLPAVLPPAKLAAKSAAKPAAQHAVQPAAQPGGLASGQRVGMVQARWEHVNREESLLTRAQSTLLDGHFVIEHKVRHDSGLFFNFNGTAGVWRRETIEDAGGWQHDTLTEDLDLSYRAQLGGWRFIYAPFVAAPAEVPPSLLAFKSQQHRWAKGSVQVARKLGWRILTSKVPLRQKLEAVAHLTGNTGYPLVLLLALLLPLVVVEQERLSSLWHLGMFLVCTASVLFFYDRSQSALGRSRRARLRDVPAAVALGIGMCVSQTRAVLEGLFQSTGEFVRTPKRGDTGNNPNTDGKGSSGSQSSYRAALVGLPGIELLLACWFAWGVALAFSRGLWGSLPFLLLFLFGFTWVGGHSLREWLRLRRG